jgi:hypothetical protein
MLDKSLRRVYEILGALRILHRHETLFLCKVTYQAVQLVKDFQPHEIPFVGLDSS